MTQLSEFKAGTYFKYRGFYWIKSDTPIAGDCYVCYRLDHGIRMVFHGFEEVQLCRLQGIHKTKEGQFVARMSLKGGDTCFFDDAPWIIGNDGYAVSLCTGHVSLPNLEVRSHQYTLCLN